MDLRSARQLLFTTKNHRILDIMLAQFKKEVYAFGRDSVCFDQIQDPPMHPANQCSKNTEGYPLSRGGERCCGVVAELSITQTCARHWRNDYSDRTINAIRKYVVNDIPYTLGNIFPGGKWHPNEYALAGLPREQWAAQKRIDDEARRAEMEADERARQVRRQEAEERAHQVRPRRRRRIR